MAAEDQAKKWNLALVVQRYGEEVNGGAELAARWLAERLTAIADVHAITTCAVDYTTWANFYPAGSSIVNGVHINRFPVDKKRNWRQSQRQTGQLLISQYSTADAVQWVRDQGPYSSPLLEFIEKTHDTFDFFIFFTYLYATTFFGLPLVPDKAILVPTAHEDPYLSMPVFHSLFRLPQALVYLTEPERDLVHRVTHNGQRPHMVSGVGIEAPDAASSERFRQKYEIEGDFLLYAGRIHESKNVPELLDYFLRFLQKYDRPLKLVLTGRSHLKLPDHPDFVHLGFVPEQDKLDALKASSLVVAPSLYESLSIVILEAWALGTPVLVNGQCAVLKHQCRRSNGGLYYTSYEEFEATLRRLLNSAETRLALGNNGRRFVATHYNWETIIDDYRALFDRIS